MGTILTQGIGGSLVNPASTSLNGVVPHVQIPQLSSGSGSGNILSSVGSLAGGILSPISSVLGGLIGHASQKSLMKRQYRYQLDLMKKQDEYTRALTRDSALLNAEGFQRAGLSRAAMQQGSFSAQNIGSTPSAPQASSAQQLPIAQAVQSLLSTALDNKIKQKQASQIQAETERVDAEKKAITDSNARENALQPSRLGILGTQDYTLGLESGYRGAQIQQDYDYRDNMIAYQKAQIAQSETVNEYQKLLNDVYKATGKKLALAQISLMLRQAEESGNRAKVFGETFKQLRIDNRFRADFDRLNNKLLDNRADLMRSMKNLYYYQGQMLRPSAAVNRSLGQQVEDGGLTSFLYGLGSRITSMGQSLLPFGGAIDGMMPSPSSASLPMFGYSY